MKKFIFEVDFGGYAEQYEVFAPNWTLARIQLDDFISHAFLPDILVKDVTYIDTRPVVG